MAIAGASVGEGVTAGLRGGTAVAERTAATGSDVRVPVSRHRAGPRHAEPRSAAQSAGDAAYERGARRVHERGHKLPGLDFSKTPTGAVGIIAVEYLIAMTIVFLFLLRKEEAYGKAMHNTFLQVSGISAVYFVLALMASGRHSARFAVAFGAMIDIAILLFRTKKAQAQRAQTAADIALLPAGLGGPAAAAAGAAASAAIDTSYDATNSPSTVVAPTPEGGQ